ncbi:MAG: DUF4349 domain-containing protein [Anaerolineae bacterium]|nr:DUF4349 domain-containing protein [Anaerolineae bacterium]
MRYMSSLRWLSLLALLVLLAGCQFGSKVAAPPAGPVAPTADQGVRTEGATASGLPAAPAQAPAAQALRQNAPPPGAAGGVGGGAAVEGPKAAATAAPAAKAADQAQSNTLAALTQVDRDIIKTAQLQISVDDVDRATDQIIALAASLGGFILDQRTQEAGIKRTATVVLRVPVNTFEEALKRLSELPGGRLDSRQIASQDVTDQLVDMESRRRNLEATEARIRSFLDQAKTVEEALRVNQQLADIQRQLEELKGRMEFTKNRAALSTITIDLRVTQPTPTVTPTPTLTPTPTPLPGWNPGDTARDATKVTVSLAQRLADAAIWTLLVGLPLALPVLLVLGLVALWRRSRPAALPPRPGNVAEPGD